MTVTALPRHTRDNPPPHGDRRRYIKWRCRCDECREAGRLYDKRCREKRLPPSYVDHTATMRQVQALVAYGFGFQDQADWLGGGNSRWPAQLARPSGPRGVTKRTAARFQAMYDEVTGKPPPSGRRATYARTVAARNGWAPPHAWDDDTISDPHAKPNLHGEGTPDEHAEAEARDSAVRVERVVAGSAPITSLNFAERVTAYRLHLHRGGTSNGFQRAHGLSGRTVTAIRLAAADIERTLAA